MARGRKKINILVKPLIGLGALAILVGISIADPWSPVSIVFVLVLVCITVVWIFNVSTSYQKRKEIEYKQEQRLKRVPSVRVDQLNFLSPDDLEHFVADLFRKLGHRAEVTKRTGDGGIDIFLVSADGTRGAVQVKKYSGTVGRPEVQKFVGATLNKFEDMFFVTTADYSEGAYQYAAEHNVKLINGQGLRAMAIRAWGVEYVNKALQFKILERK